MCAPTYVSNGWINVCRENRAAHRAPSHVCSLSHRWLQKTLGKHDLSKLPDKCGSRNGSEPKEPKDCRVSSAADVGRSLESDFKDFEEKVIQ